MKNVLISTGGTGGHVIPALNINDHLSNIFNTYIVTDLRGIKFIDKNKYKFEVIETPKFPSSLSKYPIYFFLIIYSLVKSFLYLKKNCHFENTLFNGIASHNLTPGRPKIIARNQKNIKFFAC